MIDYNAWLMMNVWLYLAGFLMAALSIVHISMFKGRAGWMAALSVVCFSFGVFSTLVLSAVMVRVFV